MRIEAGTVLTFGKFKGLRILDDKVLTIINKKGEPSIEDWD